MDNLSKKQRSCCMSRIRSSGTKAELLLKKNLRRFSYQPNLYGRPDFADFKKKIAVFIDGCFWHKCPKHYIEPKTNKSYWRPKLERNSIRAEEVNKTYKITGWKVIRIWEHELR